MGNMELPSGGFLMWTTDWWFIIIWEFISSEEILLSLSEILVPRNIGVGNRYTMDSSMKSCLFRPGYLQIITKCRDFLDAITLDDIGTGDGKIIQEFAVNLMENVGRPIS